MYSHWFVSRQKRNLTTILSALIAFSDVCVGEVWSGNEELQLKFEDELQARDITSHGSLRARFEGKGGGGTRTLFKQLKDLGLVFTEHSNGKCRLTLIGESLVKGEISFVDAMRMQLQRYQYPSATTCKGKASIDSNFKIHPFQFMFRLLNDSRLDGFLSMNEMSGLVIHYATSDSDECFEYVVNLILKFRQKIEQDVLIDEFKDDDSNKTYQNIANTIFNYISLCQYTNRYKGIIWVRSGKENEINNFIQEKPTYIPLTNVAENYIRYYGRGVASKDLRRFDDHKPFSQKALNEARICKEYVLLALKTPITGITPDIVNSIVSTTGIDENIVESFLIKNYSSGNIDDFFLSYKELAYMSRDGATDFELATCEIFRKIFKMEARHIGPIGNTPDVFVESNQENFCGIIDTKAYKKGYCINGDHLRVMEDVYIPTYKKYGHTKKELAFYSYISGSFTSNMNNWLAQITADTKVPGSAMPVDIFINFAQDYAHNEYDHNKIREVFSVNRIVQLADI